MLRKDYLLNRWVIIASGRKKRPVQFKEKQTVKDDKTCFFCKGNEHLTPNEIGRVGNWRLRWFPNKFPAVTPDEVITQKEIWTMKPATGFHEVIVETPLHHKQLWDLTTRDFIDLLNVYENRIEELSSKKGIKYVCVFKNHGKKAGTSLLHSHSQVIALPMIPTAVAEEIKAIKKSCPHCKIIQKERKSTRKCFETKKVFAFAPFASRYNYEITIFPKRHVKRISQLTKTEKNEFAEVLRKALRKIRKLNLDYNMFVHYSPKGSKLHFHITIEPRKATWGGFELCSGIIINSIPPEDAASFYRK